VANRVLKLNIGFLLAAGPGHTHETEFDVPALRVAEDVYLAYLRGKLRLSRTKEGILAQGDLHLGTQDECYRCLDPIARDLLISIEELYAYPNPNGSEFEIGEDGILDLTPLLRAEAIIADSRGELCKTDCKGICPVCGANRNHEECTCEEPIDPRFAKLQELLDPK
jgi:uncharacterized protein